jgi:uncharacterized protein YjbJ (UPF0337 family)
LKRHVEASWRPEDASIFSRVVLFRDRSKTPSRLGSSLETTLDWRVGTASPPTQENMMNWDRVEGNWKQFKGKVQQQWGKLTDDDLDVIQGNQTELAGRLQQRYGYAKDEAEKQIDSWVKTIN